MIDLVTTVVPVLGQSTRQVQKLKWFIDFHVPLIFKSKVNLVSHSDMFFEPKYHFQAVHHPH